MRRVSKIPRKNPHQMKQPVFSTESDGLQAGDSIGNRQRFSETRLSADDIGNRILASETLEVVRDDIGNSIGGAATHMQSGILAGMDGRSRRRREGGSEARGGGYAVGGVNPVVSGNNALVSLFAPAKEETIVAGAAQARPETENRRNPAAKRPEKSPESTDRWLKRLLEFEDDERSEAPTNVDPKKKATQARAVLSDIFEKAGIMAAIGTQVTTDETSGRPLVLVSFEDIDVSPDPKARLSNVFAENSLSLLALNFLLNKIVNRVPQERVKVSVNLRSNATGATS